MAHYFNVTQAVGNGCPNRPDDVALIQILLRSLNNLPESHVQDGGLVVDGVWSAHLRARTRL